MSDAPDDDGAAEPERDDETVVDDDTVVDDETVVEDDTLVEDDTPAPSGSPTPSGTPAEPSPPLTERAARFGREMDEFTRVNAASICLALTLSGIATFSIVFGTLAVVNHRNFGTWAYDGAIYDQAIWLVARGEGTFMTVRGLDVWGHHLNLVFYLFAPFYWLGAGPEFLYIVQNFVIALAALPIYLVAKERFQRPSVGLLFAVAYLMYAPIQWISWINFHPEALCIAPFMFAWWFAMKQRWRWFFVSVFFVLMMREDAALAVIMLGFVLIVTNWRRVARRPDVWIGVSTIGFGAAWYLIATQVVIPHFNQGNEAFYLEYFYGDWGGSFSGIVRNVLRHPDRVINAAMQPDRKEFYYKLGLPLGGLAILSPVHLLMAGPQMLASVIGSQPYAREILYQYPSIMIAPIVIASIEGAHFLWRRFRFMQWGLYVWLILATYISNVAWSNSPIGNGYGVWFQNNPRREAFEEALSHVPDDAVVSSSFNFGPHLSHREHSYDWPNPFWPAYWSNNDCQRFPSASIIDYLVLDLSFFPDGDPNRVFIDALIAEEQFEVVFDEQLVMVAERITPGPGGDDVPVNCPVDAVNGQLNALDFIGAAATVPEPEPAALPGNDEVNSIPTTTLPRPSG